MQVAVPESGKGCPGTPSNCFPSWSLRALRANGTAVYLLVYLNIRGADTCRSPNCLLRSHESIGKGGKIHSRIKSRLSPFLEYETGRVRRRRQRESK